jgi:hypothetical protein
MTFKAQHHAIVACVFAVSAACMGAQQPSPLPANYIKVSAPNAQKIAVSEKQKHPEIVKIGIHATPAGETANAIIAADAPVKIGKKSSDKDMEKLAAARPVSEPVDKDKIFDLFLPLTDAKGRDIGQGFVVMEVPYSRANNADEALKIGLAIRDELQKQIPSKGFLYQ